MSLASHAFHRRPPPGRRKRTEAMSLVLPGKHRRRRCRGPTWFLHSKCHLRPILSPDSSHPMASTLTTLDQVAVGDFVRVGDVAGDDGVAIRLLEMGLTPGVTVRVVGRAPFGDPLELELRGYRLSIRRAEAARVAIEPE